MAKTITIEIDKKGLYPKSKIPKHKHHRFYWYLAMYMCGMAYENGTLEDERDAILEHLMDVRKEYLESNTWEKTLKTQFESAYATTRKRKNNLYYVLKAQQGETISIVIK